MGYVSSLEGRYSIQPEHLGITERLDFEERGDVFLVILARWFRNPGVGSPVEVGSLSHYRELFIPGGAGFLPSTVSFKFTPLKTNIDTKHDSNDGLEDVSPSQTWLFLVAMLRFRGVGKAVKPARKTTGWKVLNNGGFRLPAFPLIALFRAFRFAEIFRLPMTYWDFKTIL